MGARHWLTAQFLGRRSATEYETIAYEPDRLVAWKAVSGPVPLTFSRALEAVDGGTRVTMRYEGEFRGLLKLAGPLLAAMGRRQLEGDIPRLKQLLELASS